MDAARERDWRRSANYALPLALPVGWQPLDLAPSLRPAGHAITQQLRLPLSGPLYRAAVILGLRPSLIEEPAVSNPWPELLIIGSSVAIILFGLVGGPPPRCLFAPAWPAGRCRTLHHTPGLDRIGSYARVLGLLYLFFEFHGWLPNCPPARHIRYRGRVTKRCNAFATVGAG